MSIFNDIRFLSRRYINKQIDLEYWKTYLILMVSRIEDDEKAEGLAKLLASREEDDSNV